MANAAREIEPLIPSNLRKRRDAETQFENEHNVFVRAIKKLDVYPKTVDDFTERTNVGGAGSIFRKNTVPNISMNAVSIIALTLMTLLFFSELASYLRYEQVDTLAVDLSGKEKLKINLNITFHRLQCVDVNIDVMDAAGDQQISVHTNMIKTQLDSLGFPLETTYEIGFQLSPTSGVLISIQKRSTDGN